MILYLMVWEIVPHVITSWNTKWKSYADISRNLIVPGKATYLFLTVVEYTDFKDWITCETCCTNSLTCVTGFNIQKKKKRHMTIFHTFITLVSQ